MIKKNIKNWDNKTWLSSKRYIQSFNSFLLKQINLNKNSQILDIGCGRGKILGTLSSKLKLKNKPIGLDITNHKDKDKRIKFKKQDALAFLIDNKKKFDLILIKQTIHLLSFSKIKKLLDISKKSLTSNGKIFIFTLDTKKNEIPTFTLMNYKLKKSLQRDTKILNMIKNKYHKYIKKRFVFEVKISKKVYLKMIHNKYISTLLSMSQKQILSGIDEIKHKYKKDLEFKDKLICLIL